MVPQLPQFWPSVAVLVQAPLQATSPVGQSSWQLPWLQVLPPEQTVPQPPQFSLSEIVFVQTPLHRVEPPVQPVVGPPSVPVGVLPLEQAAVAATASMAKRWAERRMAFSGRTIEGAPSTAGGRNLGIAPGEVNRRAAESDDRHVDPDHRGLLPRSGVVSTLNRGR